MGTWNKAALFKHVWAVAKKKDNLWVQWVHHVYLKGACIWDHKPTITSSWYWRKLMGVKDEFWNAGYVEKIKQNYRIADGYRWLMGKQEKVIWYEQVWNRGNFPKYSFICWLSVFGKLQTRDRLARFMEIVDANCAICSKQEESLQHMFFSCERTKKWKKEILQWLGWNTEKYIVLDLLRAVQRMKISRIKKQVFTVAIITLVYTI